jgi:multidrug efflux pump subunit AcrA (membrane-fusion protein)
MTERAPKTLIATLLVSAVGAGAALVYTGLPGTGAGQPVTQSRSVAAARYRCPMHPSMVSEQPGDCAICGMRLVSIEEPEGEANGLGTGDSARGEHKAQATAFLHPGSAPHKTIIYRSTMNPAEVSDRPGKDSMGMEMVPGETEAVLPDAGPAVAGRARIQLPDRKRQLIGVRTTEVVRKPLTKTIKTVGRVTFDETRLRHVHAKVTGWIEHLYANATGERVKAGEPLLTIYSPELVASVQEYLIARHGAEKLREATLPDARQGAQQLLASARRRLLLFDLTPGQIGALEKRGDAPTTVTLRSQVSGYVISRNVTEGERIEPGTNLLDVADLSRVWVLADAYEYELPFLRLGQSASMTLSYLPGRSFEGQITLIYPVVAEATRTVKVRLEFPNPDLMLRPEMYADVEIRSDLGRALVVPESAVMSTGTRDIAFVDRGDGYLEPRELKIGTRLADEFAVLEGLAEGERVVTSGNFLVDAESNLKAALSAAGSRSGPQPAEHAQ